MSDTFDAVIVGSGAGAGPLALSLSRAGWRILVLEKGPRYKRDDYVLSELAHLERPHMFVPSIMSDPHLLIDRCSGEITRTALGWTASCVGGGTSHMGASLYRMRPVDFEMHTHTGGYEQVADWPITYAALRKYYRQAEKELGVSGSQLSTAYADPLPMPPLPTHPFVRRLDDALAAAGVQPRVTAKGINSRPYGGRQACARCAYCAGFGCPVGARASSYESLLSRAEGTGLCEIRPNAMVYRVTVERKGRVGGVLYIDQNNNHHEARASLICVCCSAIESARLLLLSRCALYPDGLGNDHGNVGRYLQFHISSSGHAVFAAQSAGQPDTSPHLLRSVSDYYTLPTGGGEIAKGGTIKYEMSRAGPIRTAYGLAFKQGQRVVWGNELLSQLRDWYRAHDVVEYEVFQDFIPNHDTYMDLDSSITDRWGLPVARFSIRHPPHHPLAAQHLSDMAQAPLVSLGAEAVYTDSVGETSRVMVHGTCRFGNDPRSSVIDQNCGCHGLENLFVVDGSFMPTSGGVPSTLTIVANSFRVADHILHTVNNRPQPDKRPIGCK